MVNKIHAVVGLSAAALAILVAKYRAGPFKSTIRALLGLRCPGTFGGKVAPGWEPVQEALRSVIHDGYELGAQFAVYYQGVKVVDIWGASEPGFDGNSKPVVYSSTKALVTSLVIAMLEDRGLLSYDDPIAKHWPEFAKCGKEKITVADLMRHEAGLDAFYEPIPLQTFYDPFNESLEKPAMHVLIEKTTPVWPDNTRRCYHAITRGLVANELVRRVDPKKRTIKYFFQEEVAGPLGADVTVGLPAE